MTKFSIGFLDSLFGEKIQIELPGPTGETVQRTVTKKWWDRMIAEGKIKRVDPLEKQAKALVPSAQLNAVALYQALVNHLPILKSVDLDEWDFFVTVAGVFVAATRLSNSKIGESREDALMDIVARAVDEWDGNGATAFFDCKDLFEREYDRLSAAGHDVEFIAADALGIWIAWNVLGHQPRTEDEVALVRASGAAITHAFFDWWTDE